MPSRVVHHFGKKPRKSLWIFQMIYIPKLIKENILIINSIVSQEFLESAFSARYSPSITDRSQSFLNHSDLHLYIHHLILTTPERLTPEIKLSVRWNYWLYVLKVIRTGYGTCNLSIFIVLYYLLKYIIGTDRYSYFSVYWDNYFSNDWKNTILKVVLIWHNNCGMIHCKTSCVQKERIKNTIHDILLK